MAEENLEMKKSEIAKKEEEILKFWQENKIFEKSLEQTKSGKEFIFYDGPPFATGLPHYGHLLAGTIKDVIPRYKTMKGYHVRRRWGWDCHGLPIENLIEKELDLKSKKDIEEFGVENFNLKARESVLRYADEWKKIVPRLGRFVDMEDDYRTMDASYSETTWWIFKTLHDKGLVYEGYKSMHICPRCETTLSNFEVTQGYKDVTDISVTVKFELEDEPNTCVLAWTTTPWTLPGNVALAVGKDITYAKIKIGDNFYILAKDRLTIIKDTYELVEEMKGQDLVGKKYKALFNYYQDDVKLENKENGWKIYGADFVTTEDGTGVVHIAPAFGEDDLNLGRANNLPFVQHVAMNGTFKPEIKEWAGLQVKPIEDPQATDILVLKYLAGKETLFAKEKFTHSYPHCWRCNTPLLNYATSSWFIKVSELKDKLVEVNKKVNWVPEHVRDGRFGKWLEGARDWAISRSRYWGAPLPAWRCNGCGTVKVIGSYNELADLIKKSGNKFWAMRHGEAKSNTGDFISADPKDENYLTDKGKKEVVETGERLKENKIDLIISSDFVRTKETAEIMADKLGLDKTQIIFDERLREINVGDFAGKTWVEYNEAYGSPLNLLFNHLPTGGENYNDIRKRVMSLLFELDEKYQNKNILVISHGLPLFMMQATLERLSNKQIVESPRRGLDFGLAEARAINFWSYPHNYHYEFDIHRPYVDGVSLPCSCGGEAKRVPEVFDCWYESGSMPYAQDHYPIENLDIINPTTNIGFPADFIAEGLDQTRGWFYSLIVLGVGLFGQSPFKNVVTNGLVLAESGQKMSKSLRNYTDPMEIANEYGADALRLYLMTSPAVKGEDLYFSNKGVAEIQRKIVMRLLNILAFYQIYQTSSEMKIDKLSNVLDTWILVRLKETIKQTEKALEKYEIDRSIRPLDEFIEDLSTWYLRRSRDRFKDDGSDKQSAIFVTRFVLQEVAKLLAPLAPFVADMVYQELKNDQDSLSVHLSAWPESEIYLLGKINENEKKEVIEKMAETRKIVSLGLEFRQQMKIKVRQPLSELKVKGSELVDQEEYIKLIKDELNVKTISFGQDVEGEVWLDGELTDDLVAEGVVRELIRQLQELRKKLGLNPMDKINLTIEAETFGQNLLKQFESELKIGTASVGLDYGAVDEGETIEANELSFKVKITKL